MATYSLQELLNRWQREDLTVEQTIGQLLQHLLTFEKEILNLKQRLNKLSSKKNN